MNIQSVLRKARKLKDKKLLTEKDVYFYVQCSDALLLFDSRSNVDRIEVVDTAEHKGLDIYDLTDAVSTDLMILACENEAPVFIYNELKIKE